MSPLHTQRLSRPAQGSALLSLARTVRTSFRNLIPAGAGCDSLPQGHGALPLAARIKHELQAAFDRGEQPAIADYLEAHPELTTQPQVMLSLLFEEFCLREQHGLAPDPESFCARYEPWRDSLASQIRVHHELSRHVSFAKELVVFPEAGDQILHYNLVAELGEGGSARVFVAQDSSLGDRLCALKLSMDHGAEAALQASLDHPHIIPVHSVKHDKEWNLRALCMPFLPGIVLAQVIEQLHAKGLPRDADALRLVVVSAVASDAATGVPDEPDGWSGFPSGRPFAVGVAWLGLKLAEALHHAHGRAVFHRDIKPANILLTKRNGPMLFDFNLAHGQVQGQGAATAATGGTLPYMAPEQLAAFLDSRRWSDVGAPADVYSLGLVLRELLTGPAPVPPPVPASQTTQLIADLWAKRCAEPPGPIRSPSQRVPFAIDAILARCLDPDLSQRYGNAAELAEDLRRFLHRRPLRYAVNPSRRERVGNALHRHRKSLRNAAVMACSLAVLLGAWLALRPTPVLTGPELALSLVEDASVHTRSGRLDEAVSEFLQAIRHDPTLYTPHMGLARIAFQHEQYDEAATRYSQALRLMPSRHIDDQIIALDCRGRSYYYLASQHQQQAIQIYQSNDSRPTQGANDLMRRARTIYSLACDDLAVALALAHQKIEPGSESRRGPVLPNSTRTADLAQRLSQARLGLGDAASWFEDYPTSVDNYNQALNQARYLLRYLKAHLSPGRKSHEVPLQELPRLARAESTVETLITTIQNRLQADLPKLDRHSAN